MWVVQCHVPAFAVDGLLKEGDEVSGLTVIHVPGHTPGSIALYDRARKVMFSGDTLRFVGGKLEGPSEKFSADLAQARKSVEKLKPLDFDILLGGHGEPLKGGASAKVRML